MMRAYFLVALAIAVALAQVPPNQPCQLAALDCCVTRLEHVVIAGVSYAYQVCGARTTPACTTGCECAGLCSDSTARCTCISPSSTMMPTQTRTPTANPTQSPSPTAAPTGAPTESPTAAPTVSPSMNSSPSASVDPTLSPRVNLSPSVTPTRPKKSPSTTPLSLSSSASRAAHEKHHSSSGSSTKGAVVGASVSALVCFCLALLILATLSTWRWYQRRRLHIASGAKPLSTAEEDGTELVTVNLDD